MMAGRHPFDPVTQEIIEGKLIATVDEMGIVMARTSMSPVIYEVLDFACGVLTAKGELIAQMNGITLFTGTFGRQVKSLIDRFGADMADGDILLTNDPYAGERMLAISRSSSRFSSMTCCSPLPLMSLIISMLADRFRAVFRRLQPRFIRKVCGCRASKSFATTCFPLTFCTSSRKMSACPRSRLAI